MTRKLWLLTASLLSPLAGAQSLQVQHAYVRATPPNAATSAVFATLVNHDNQDHYIVDATTPAAEKAELHDVIHQGEVMKMRQIEALKVPANSTLQLKPGSFHIMLFRMPKPLVEGDDIEVNLTLRSGEQLRFIAPIKNVMSEMRHH